MDYWSSRWREFAFLVVLCWATTADKDISEFFQRKEDNPPALNDFLANVNEHRGDFNFVKQAAQRFQKIKKNAQPEDDVDLVDLDDIYSGYDFLNKQEMKRHVHNVQNNKKKRYRTFSNGDEKRHFRAGRKNRFRRLAPDNFDTRAEFLDFSSNAAHKSQGVGKNRHYVNAKDSKNEQKGNEMYVDLGEEHAKNQEKFEEKLSPLLPLLPSLSNFEEDRKTNVENEGKRNPVLPRWEIAQPNPGEDANFERAQTFELDSNDSTEPPEQTTVDKNDPDGNDLMSVDAGQVETYFNGRPQDQIVNNPMGVNVPHNRLGLVKDVEELAKSKDLIKFAPKNYQLNIEPRRFQPKEQNPTKISQKVGNGFIEIAKTRRNDLLESPKFPKMYDYDDYRRFQSRNLKFFLDEDMIDSDVADLDYDRPLPRVRRDFLDALGMSNEEEYGEDNPYSAELNVTNTDVNNDTHIVRAVNVSFSLPCTKNGTENDDCEIHKETSKGCNFPPVNHEVTTISNQKNDVNNIKQMLEEPKQNPGDGTNEGFKKIDRRSDDFDSFEDFDDVVEEVDGIRRSNRDVSGQVGYGGHPFRNRGKFLKKRDPDFSEFTTFRNNGEKLGGFHKIDKKEDLEGLMQVSATPQAPSATTNGLQSTSDGSYEKVAQEIDKENEKLAEVVDGRTASKIVATVFEKLHSKSSLKTKFYSGLSRKHLNYAGTVEINIFKANETHEDVAEAKILLNQITKVLNKLVMNQVRRRLCQRLPDELREFLKTAVDVKSGVSGSETFVPNGQQGDFLFETANDGENSPFNAKQLQETLVSLESLLLKYHKMDDDCQSRAEPIKEYIERHINILRQIVSSGSFGKSRRDSDRKRNALSMFDNGEEDKLVQKQLESLGLGGKRHFVPNFDINKIVQNRIGDEDNDVDPNLRLVDKRDVANAKFSKSDKFKKLQTAARIIREKRDDVRKISQVYYHDDGEGKNGKSKRSIIAPGVDGKFQENFEQPVVYSIG